MGLCFFFVFFFVSRIYLFGRGVGFCLVVGFFVLYGSVLVWSFECFLYKGRSLFFRLFFFVGIKSKVVYGVYFVILVFFNVEL